MQYFLFYLFYEILKKVKSKSISLPSRFQLFFPLSPDDN